MVQNTNLQFIQVHGMRRAVLCDGPELGGRDNQLGPGVEHGTAVYLQNFYGF